MKRLPFAFLLLALPAAGFSQTRPVTPVPAAPFLKADEAPAPDTTAARPREISPDTTAKINSALPKFSPPKLDAKKPEEQPDLREIDKPRNGIIRLPKYIVQELKTPTFKDRELLTPQGKLDLAYKRHPGLRFGSLPFLSNNGPALFMLEEERQLERKSEMEELYGLYNYSDPKAGAAVKRETNTTFIRHDAP